MGTHALTVVYAGDATVATSASPVVREVVLAYDFSLTPPTGAVTLPAGDWTNVVLTLTPLGGFRDSVALACSGLPAHAQCVFDSGETVSLANGSRQVTLTVNTSDIYRYGPETALRRRDGTHRWGAVIAALLLPSLALWRGRRRLAILICLLVMVAGLQSCSSKQPAIAAPGIYPVTVQATETASPSLQHTAALSVTVR